MPKRIKLISLNPAMSLFTMEPQVHILYEDDDGRASGTYLAERLLGEEIFAAGFTPDFAVLDSKQPGIVQSLDGTLPKWHTPGVTPDVGHESTLT